MLAHTLSEIIATLLVGAGFGKWSDDAALSAADWMVTYESFPDEHDLALMTQDVEGKREDKRNMRTGEPALFPGCAVHARALDDRTAKRQAVAVARFLDAMAATCVTVDTSKYAVRNFSRLYDPVFLMQEDRNDRRVWIFRGNVTVTQEQ